MTDSEALTTMTELLKGTPRIAAVLIARDEASMLPGCLESLCGAVDEIVLMDTGSLDETRLIALRSGVKVGCIPWRDDFAYARNAALAMTDCDWALWIDADERLTPESAEMLKAAVANATEENRIGGYEIEILNRLDDGEQFLHRPVRLFRNLPGVQFEGRIHEQIAPSIARAGYSIATLNGATLLHLGYAGDVMQAKNKLERTIRLCRAEVKAAPDDAFAHFNLANAYHCAADHASAVQVAAAAHRLLTGAEPYASNLFQIEMASLIELGELEAAQDVAQIAEELGVASILIRFELGRTLALLGQYTEAMQCLELALATPDRHQESGDPGVRAYKIDGFRARLLLALGRDREAVELCGELLALGIEAARPELIETLLGCAVKAHAEGDYELATGRAIMAAEWGDARGALFALQIQHEVKASDLLASCQTVEDAFPDLALESGRIRYSVGDYQGACFAFGIATERESRNADAWFCLGDAAYASRAYSRAAEAYETGLRLNPDHAEGWFTLGNALAQLGGDAVAERCYRHTLELDPRHDRAAVNLHSVRRAA